MIDAIDELVARSKPHHELARFHRFHREHPEVLDFLVSEIRLRIERGFEAFSFASLWHYARWKLDMKSGPTTTFLMNDHATPYYARAITILHAEEFNGRAEFRGSTADKVFGTELAPSKDRKGRRLQRLRWADGTPLESGWRPTVPHVVGVGDIPKRADIHTRPSRNPS